MEERLVVLPPLLLQRRQCIFYEPVVTSDIKQGKEKKTQKAQIPLGYLAPLKAKKREQMFSFMR